MEDEPLEQISELSLSCILRSLPIDKRKELVKHVPGVRDTNLTAPYKIRQLYITCAKGRPFFYVHMDSFNYGLPDSATSFPVYQTSNGRANVHKVEKFLAFHLDRPGTYIRELIDRAPLNVINCSLVVGTVRLEHSGHLKNYLDQCFVDKVVIRDRSHRMPMNALSLFSFGVVNASVLDIRTRKLELPINAFALFGSTVRIIHEKLTSRDRMEYILRMFLTLGSPSEYTGDTSPDFAFQAFEQYLFTNIPNVEVRTFLFNLTYFAIKTGENRELIVSPVPNNGKMVLRVAPVGENICFVLNK